MRTSTRAHIATLEAEAAEAHADLTARIAAILAQEVQFEQEQEHVPPQREDADAAGERTSTRTVEMDRETGRILILDALATAPDGRLHWQSLYEVIERTGFSNRVLGGLKTAGLLLLENDQVTFAITDDGRERWDSGKHLLDAVPAHGVDRRDGRRDLAAVVEPATAAEVADA